ncbi:MULTISPECIES: pyridoxal-phosphate dependent enzyme [Aliivibrio]|jgi:cysteine synthase A|uniref:cysteine synthase n=1 Tax=Aliivibrio sifiae TaxID=566293 RepID=A0A2S7XCU5_9GAMM|nr:pyridoxal-phosphate dependent enzyme [Aliivibrio sifiae]PQJ88926.1 hypothetical protein BTO22_04720 [Aliivibrio sifiae]
MNLPTPLISLKEIDKDIYAKIEYLHPSGSMKHRSIPKLLKTLHLSGELKGINKIAICSAGAAAITTAWAAEKLGYSVIAVLPSITPKQTIKVLKWLGVTCYQVEDKKIAKLMQKLNALNDVYILSQMQDKRLIDHYRDVTKEVVSKLTTVSAITVGIGTGASIMGIGREMNIHQPNCKIVGVEPSEAAIVSGSTWAEHNIPGLAPPMRQSLLDKTLLNNVLTISSEQAWSCAHNVARTSGLFLGPSSGACVSAAIKLRAEGTKGPIVAICACSINDYL